MKDEQWWRDEGCRIDATQDDTRERGWVLRRLVGASASESFSRCSELLLHSSSYLYHGLSQARPFLLWFTLALIHIIHKRSITFEGFGGRESQMQASEFKCRIFPVEIERDVA